MPKKLSAAKKVWQTNSVNPKSLINFGNKYFKSQKSLNYSQSTINTRQYYLGDFVLWCREIRIFNINQVTEEIINNYQISLYYRPSKTCKGLLSLNSRIVRMQSICLFFKWLVKKKYLKNDPTLKIEFNKQPKRLPSNILSVEEMERVLNSIDTSRYFGVRNRAMLETLYSTGIRRRELVNIDLSDIDFTRGLLLIRNGKGKKDRLIPIGERALKWIQKYIDEMRCEKAVKSETALFITYRGKRFCDLSNITGIARKSIQKAEVEKQGACHLVRHTTASLMLENGASTRYIQSILGHESVATTQIYTRVAITRLKEVYEETREQVKVENEIAPKLKSRGRNNHDTKGYKFSTQQQQFWQQEDKGNFVTLALRYLEWMNIYGYGSTTIKQQRHFLRYFIVWCHERDITDVEEITSYKIEDYQSYTATLKNSKTNQLLSAKNRSDRVLTVLLFYRWLKKNNHIATDPGLLIELPKLPKKLPHNILTKEEIERTLAAPDLSTYKGIRDRAMLEILNATGVRRMEIANLTIHDLDKERGTLKILEGKGKKDRVIPISEQAIEWVEKYIEKARPFYANEKSGNALFLNKAGRSINVSRIGEFVKHYFSVAGVSAKGACHLFRNTLATRMLEGGADIRHIQLMLGHSHLDSTERYTHVNISKLKEVHTRTHPARMYPTKTGEIIAEIEEGEKQK